MLKCLKFVPSRKFCLFGKVPIKKPENCSLFSKFSDMDKFEIKKESSSESMCRLCLQERDRYRSVFQGDSTTLATWIENLTSLKISYVPDAPAALCLECETILKNFESFREMCFSNDSTFRDMFPQTEQPAIVNHVDGAERRDIYTFEYVVKQESDLQSDAILAIEDIPAEVDENNAPELADEEWEVSHHAANDEQLPYQCSICLRRFRVERNLRRHGRVHMPKLPKVQCGFCRKTLLDDTALRIHMRIHTQEELYGCLECGQSFSTSGLLTRHVRSHSQKRKFDCRGQS
ncbi:zinc finger protein 26 [Aedes albopictus]|uniref:C2h2-type zn-finger protein n=1 Tax=Aedes albopictus TaxID=7160 RepID=A0ABM1ZBJ3_AEDAL